MSVGKGEDASDGGGSEDYDDEEEEEEEYNNTPSTNTPNTTNAAINLAPKEPSDNRRAIVVFPMDKSSSSTSQHIPRIPQVQVQQQPQRPPHLGTVVTARSNHPQQDAGLNFHRGGRNLQDKLPKDAGSSMYYFNVAAAHTGDMAAKAAAAVAAATATTTANASVPRGDGEPLNNYYTSLLTSFPAATTTVAATFRNFDHPGHNQEQQRRGNNFQTAEQPLRQILSDPVSGDLMDDATIFPCGHSFGPAGVQRIQETHQCFICQAPTRVDTGSTNFALRLAVQAFRNDRGIPKPGSSRAAKRRRDQDGAGGEAFDGNRNKGVQFPYVVSDRVLIKGNKRTPERFVGKEAIITTQCLNGWYLVRTIDNGESVRLQYRSLQKIEGDGANWNQQEQPVAVEFASVNLSTQNS